MVPAYEANYMSTVIGMVNSGLGIAVLPEVAVSSGAYAHMRRVAISKPVLRREIVIVRKKGRSLSPAASKMIEVLEGSHVAGILNRAFHLSLDEVILCWARVCRPLYQNPAR